MGTTNVLESARLYPKIKAVVIASSDKAYGKLDSGQYVETDPLRGDHPYDVSKSATDLIANMYDKTYQVPHLS
jgi:CDP-glucose 4,6-dehydratase